jgi:hypothetical protein
MSQLQVRLVSLVLASALFACADGGDGAAHLWTIHGQPTQGPAGPTMDQLAARVPDTAQIDTYYTEFDAAYSQVFTTTVKALREKGDAVRLADGDVGYIATDPSQHWPLLRDSYSLQYLIVFERVSPVRTRMIFKILQWDLAFGPTDNLQRLPIGSALVVDSRFQQETANSFARLLRKRMRG